MSIKIAALADVSLGFGSTQIPEFIKFLLTQYKDSEAVVLEPDQPEKRYIKDRYPEFVLKRVTTLKSCYTSLGRIEYINKVTKLVNELEPDILVIFCSFCLPVLNKLKKKPSFVIYYNIEMASFYGHHDMTLNKALNKGNVDLLIYPEENRRVLDIQKFGYKDIPAVIMYNCANTGEVSHILPAQSRNDKIIYYGTLDIKNTNAQYFMGSDLQEISIDIFGNFSGDDREQLKHGYAQLCAGVRYYGFIDNKELRTIRPHYAFSIVAWAPVNENQYYAAPNKFFEAISDGVVPICAPHPQCEKIIKKYDCGILMEDWSYESFKKAIRIALNLYKTSEYEKLVANCKIAVEQELNFKIQTQKVVSYLKKI